MSYKALSSHPRSHLPFGLRAGRMFRPSEVATGLACQCHCPSCGGKLVAKNAGTTRRHHFAHHRGDGSCSSGRETAIHKAAKQVLADRKYLYVPAWDGARGMPNPPCRVDGSGFLRSDGTVTVPASRIEFWKVELERSIADCRPDATAHATSICEENRQPPLLIEIRVTHKVSDEKAARIRAAGQYRMVEIDLSKLTDADLDDPVSFEWLVLGDAGNKRWVCHPEAERQWHAAAAAAELKRDLAMETDPQRRKRDAQPRTQPISSSPINTTVRITAVHPKIGARIVHAQCGPGVIVEWPHTDRPLARVQFPDRLRWIWMSPEDTTTE